MALYKSIIAYDGTEFQGFQRQADGTRTVQGALEEALRSVGWQGNSLAAAGRTDTGVHARGQVIAFDMAWRHSAEALSRALNAGLPPDVSVFSTKEAQPGFHPRRSARRRRYVYTMLFAPVRDPLRERYAWRVWPALEIERMRQAAESLLGRHDFGAFGRSPTPGGHTTRQVFRAEWGQSGELASFSIEGDAFLYRMVRRLAAMMHSVGSGRMYPEEVSNLIDHPGMRWEGDLAPACGLCLEAVTYEDEQS